MTAIAIAWVGTLAFVGWVLWLRERRAETVTERLDITIQRVADLETTAKARDELLVTHANAIKDTRTLVDNVQMRLGFGPKKQASAPGG